MSGNALLDRLLEEITLLGPTAGGAVTYNPKIMAQGFRNRLRRSGVNALDPYPGFRDDMMPNRNMMRVPRNPMGNIGIHAWPFPGANMPNQYQGEFEGRPTPDAPEYYVPGFTDQWLRGI